jgi:hypothetical protein
MSADTLTSNRVLLGGGVAFVAIVFLLVAFAWLQAHGVKRDATVYVGLGSLIGGLVALVDRAYVKRAMRSKRFAVAQQSVPGQAPASRGPP